MDVWRHSRGITAIRGIRPLAVRPEQARDGIRIIELALESSRLGSELPFVE